ncbi:N-acetyl sugar amidotransferase [Minwuia thermotolerans]|uniref:N-acetyl sugar amidotransferase n=1 Tax=Minwuia thermotolerans TaxID=2056226 RepID=A0A2M9G676_9PROT|nr:N-acetyl sugar amidotransferase [Minwuia thermotolerans]
MPQYPARVPVDSARYAPDRNDPEIFYGLPREVRFCRKSLISNQRPNSTVEFKHTRDSRKSTIHFDENGVSDAWHVARMKDQIDWTARRDELEALLSKYRRNDGGYDVLVPGSGGKDSFYAAHVLKYEFGMHPLTVTWAPHIYTDWGWKNQQAWIHAGFDNYLMTPNGRVHRLLTRLAVENILHPFQPFILGQKQLAPKMAALFNIPLVMFGENEAEYGNPKADADQARRDWDYFSASDESEVHLGGTSIRDLVDKFGLHRADLQPYMPANPEDLRQVGVDVHYLGYYLPWHPQGAYYYAVEHGGFQASPERTAGTYSKYNSIDDKIDDFHYYTTYIKFGIGRAMYDASQEIRSGEIDFEEAKALVRRYDGEFPERFADEIFEYMSLPPEEFPVASKQFEQPIMDRAYFDNLCDRFRSPHLWMLNEGQWELRHKAWEEAEELVETAS